MITRYRLADIPTTSGTRKQVSVPYADAKALHLLEQGEGLSMVAWNCGVTNQSMRTRLSRLYKTLDAVGVHTPLLDGYAPGKKATR